MLAKTWEKEKNKQGIIFSSLRRERSGWIGLSWGSEVAFPASVFGALVLSRLLLVSHLGGGGRSVALKEKL